MVYSHNHPARDPRALAQGRFSLLLALEVAKSGQSDPIRVKGHVYHVGYIDARAKPDASQLARRIDENARTSQRDKASQSCSARHPRALPCRGARSAGA
jgi:hypothetical protein